MTTLILTVTCGLIAGLFRHPLGVSPILGAVLCAACFLRPRELWVVGLGGILLRDLVLGLSAFTAVRVAGMAAVVAVVLALNIRPNLRSLLAGIGLSSPVFHLVLAAGDWATGTCAIWPKTPTGLLASVATTLPYFEKALLSDILFASVFLALYTGLAYVGASWKARWA